MAEPNYTEVVVSRVTQRFFGIYKNLRSYDSMEVALRDPGVSRIVGRLMETEAGKAMAAAHAAKEEWEKLRAPLAAMLACSMEIAYWAKATDAVLAADDDA